MSIILNMCRFIQILFEFERLTEMNLTDSLHTSMQAHSRAIHFLSQAAFPDQADLDADEYEGETNFQL